MARGRVRHLRANEYCPKWGCANQYGIYWGKSLRCTIHQEYRIQIQPEPVSKPVKVEKKEVRAAPVQLNLFSR